MNIKQYFKRSLPVLFVFIVFCGNSIQHFVTAQRYLAFTIPDPDSVFQNQYLDPYNDVIYIGALNNIYKLSENLTLLASAKTGPVNDSVSCRPPPADCQFDRTSTENYNKVILLHEDRLITCGSIYQGTCRVREPESLGVTYGGSTREVVPNTPDGLAVAFIADGNVDQVLYIASSVGRWLRESIPTVSTRQISKSVQDDKLFKTTSDNSRIFISPNTIDESPGQQFNISYVYGFTSGQFSYFVASQPPNHLSLSRYTSKIVRLCHGSPDFNSYIELPLVCATDDEYNLIQSAYLATLSLGGAESEAVLVAAFSKPETEVSGTPSPESAICVYPVEDINQEFWNRRLACAQGNTGNTEIGWAGSTACWDNEPLFQYIIGSSPDEYCHTSVVQNPLGGDNRAITISASPVYESSTYITAVSAVQHFETSIIFTGDSSGRFRKLRVDNGTSAVEYESINLSQSPVIRNGLLLSDDQQFLYVTSVKRITKVPVEECQEHTTCEACHNARDPYCGWCSLQAKCTRRIVEDCSASQNGRSLRWLSADEDCLAITSVSPEFAPAETVTQLTLEVSSLPSIPIEGSLRCLFIEGESELGAVAAEASGVTQATCYTPGNIQGTEKGFRTVDLLIFYDEGGESYNIAKTSLDFYDCSKFLTCSSCTMKQYGCLWDLFGNECRDGGDGAAGIQDRNKCPVVYSDSEIFIPAGGVVSLSFAGDNIPSDSGQLRCEVTFPDSVPRKIAVDASASSTSINCSPASLNYSGSEEFVSGSLQVYWGDFPLDMESEQIITIYKCERKAVTMLNGEDKQTCGMCLSVKARYRCGWCPALNECLSPITSGRCHAGDYLTGGMGCPNPTIVSISPVTGHIAGGTRVNINGFNLGLNVVDVREISLAGTPCISVEFISSQMLSCVTSGGTQGRRGVVTVEFNDTSTSSTQEFTYVKPSISLSYPMVGPQSGGTRLVVRGNNMDAGLDRSVMISSAPCTKSDSDYPCEIEEYNAEEIICKTSASNITDGILSVNFDLGCEFLAESFFEYLPDPVVVKFEKLNSIRSGGINLEITGGSFNIIQEASLNFKVGSQVLSGPCSNSSDGTRLNCKSPGISSTNLPLKVPVMNVSLYMDGVTSYVDLGRVFPGTNEEFFGFVVDPVYYDLPAGEDLFQVPYMQRSDIIIEGANLSLASSSSDVAVKVGGSEGLLLELTDTSLGCKLPELKDPGIYNVQIFHGNRNFQPGQVEYEGPPLPLTVTILTIAVPSFVTTMVTVGIVAYYIGRRSSKDKQTDDQKRVHHSYFSKNSPQVNLTLSITDDNDYHSIDNNIDYFSVTEETVYYDDEQTLEVTPVAESDPGENREEKTSSEISQAAPPLPQRNDVEDHTDSQQTINETQSPVFQMTNVMDHMDSEEIFGGVAHNQAEGRRPLREDTNRSTEFNFPDEETSELPERIETGDEERPSQYSDNIHRDQDKEIGVSENSTKADDEEKFSHYSNRRRAIQCAEYGSGRRNLHTSENGEGKSNTMPDTDMIGHAIDESNEEMLQSNLTDPYCNKIYSNNN